MKIKTNHIRTIEGLTLQIDVLFINCETRIIDIFKGRFPDFQFLYCIEDSVVYSRRFKKETAATIAMENLQMFIDLSEKACAAHEAFSPRTFSASDRDLLAAQMCAIAHRYEGLAVDAERLMGISGNCGSAGLLRDECLGNLEKLREALGHEAARIFCLKMAGN